MSWDQDYNVESIDSFLSGLAGKSCFQLIKEELERQGITIMSAKTIVLTTELYIGDIMGAEITLSDGRVFRHKLVKRYTSNGNYGCDTYKLLPKDAEVKIEEINEDEV